MCNLQEEQLNENVIICILIGHLKILLKIGERPSVLSVRPLFIVNHRAVRWNSTDVSEEHIASIIRVDKHTEQETNTKQVASKTYYATLKMETFKIVVTLTDKFKFYFYFVPIYFVSSL
jgi:hypothetical protein